MSIPTLTLRTLKNRNSGIDIVVPSVQETEAPLGGTSVEYEIAIATSLPFFKTRLHSSKDVVQFSVYKAYREVEDLYVRLQKKFSLPDLPPIPHGNKILACSTQEKQKALENFFMFIAQKADICSSSSFTQFVGISSQKHEVTFQNEKTSQKKSVLDVETKHNEDANEKEEKSFLEEIWPTEKEKASLTITSEIDLFNSAEKIIAENARRKSDLECAPDLYPVIVSDPLQNELCGSIEEKGDDSNVVFLSKNNSVDEDDLFEEVKRQKETRNKETQMSENNQKSYRGLFDDIDDGRSDLFAKLSGVHVSKGTGSDNVLEEADKLFVPTKLSAGDSGSSDFGNSFMRETNSDKDREGKTLGDISLFEEQDFGNAITIDEESLFLITETDDDKIKKKNPLLFSKLESSTTIKDESSEIVESLDDLLDMAPLPEASASSRKRHQFDSSAHQLPDVKKEPSLPEIMLKVSSSSEERIELIQPEVKMEPTLAAIKTEPTLAAIKTEHTLAVVETGPTLASVKPETTPAELIPEPAPAELIPEPAPAELIQELTPAELKTESIIAEVRKKPSPPEIKKKPSPAEFKKEPPPPYLKTAHPSRPVPMPRKNPIPPKLVGTKPEVQPRTVFLSKPSLPPKPVPPPKPKPNRNSLKGNLKMSGANDKSNAPTSKSLAGVHKQVDNATGELSSVDLLQYIENEKKSSSNANLFD